MKEESKIRYTDAVNGARNGDEDSFEFLYNESVKHCRALCMKYYDPATEAGRQKVDSAVGEIYVRLYDRIKRLSDPEDFPILLHSLTRDICQKGKGRRSTLGLSAEPYLSVGAEGGEPAALVTAEACRKEVHTETTPENETLGELVLSTLHGMTADERLAILRWNDNDGSVMAEPLLLREAFIKAEKAVMALEEKRGFRARDFAKSRLSFFNLMLDLYDRYYQASSLDWAEAAEPAAAALLDDAAPEAVRKTKGASPASFPIIWNAIRQNFYLQNTMELPGGMAALARAGQEEPDEDYHVYLDGEEAEEEADSGEPARAKKSFLKSGWGRALLGLLLVALILAGVIATAGQHTSHAKAPGNISVQSDVFLFEQSFEFNGS